MGIAGSDVLMEFDHPEIYAPVDLGVGGCRMVVASPVDDARKEAPAAGATCVLRPNIRMLHAATLLPAVFRRNVSS